MNSIRISLALAALLLVAAAQAQPVLTLTPDSTCYGVSDTVTVTVDLSGAGVPIVGGQFLLAFNTTNLTFVSMTPGDAAATDPTNPFEVEIAEVVSGGGIAYAVGIPNGAGGATSGTMAVITFTAAAEVCNSAGLVSFSTLAGFPPTRLVDANDAVYSVANANLTLNNLASLSIDSTAPTLACPANAAFECAADVPAPDVALVTASDNCGSATVTFVSDTNNAGAGCVGNPLIITRTYRATDACGNFADCTQTFTIQDITAPTLACPADAAFECAADVPAPDVALVTASDNCGSATVTFVSDTNNAGAGCVGNPLIITRTYRATDACGNFADCTQTFTVQDITAPTIACPADAAFECAADVPAPDVALVTASDNCGSATVTFVSDTNNAGAGCVGNPLIITRTYRATDACGNFADCTQTFTIQDITAPTLSIPADITTDADVGGCDALLSVGTATGSDNCGSVTITGTRSDALLLTDPYPSGTTTITWDATDTCGNLTSLVQTIIVNPVNTLIVDVELSPTVDPLLTRCISFELFECGPDTSVSVDADITFVNGLASGVSISVPCGLYTCITARDALHTLRRTDLDNFGIVGSTYVADFTDNSGVGGDDDRLVNGNLNDDDFIDIIDFGLFANRFGVTYDSDGDLAPDGDTPCGVFALHADISGDGLTSAADFTFIQINFFTARDANCCGLPGRGGQPLSEISVTQLRKMGLGRLRVADLNGDGVLDQLDVVEFLNGARPTRGRKAIGEVPIRP